MKQWQDVIEKSAGATPMNIYLLNDNKKSEADTEMSRIRQHCLKKSQYFASGKYASIYFTRREAECLYYLLRGMTITATAAQLDLSPRTVEFYVKNMKRKLHVKTKYDLVECLHEVNFLRQLETEIKKG